MSDAPRLTVPMAPTGWAGLRAKTHHSWLDHCIAMVSSEMALQRARAGSWEAEGRRSETLYQIALNLGQSLDRLRVSNLVNEMHQFDYMEIEERAALGCRLDELQAKVFDVASVSLQYHELLEALWSQWRLFIDLALAPHANAAEIEARWLQVQSAGFTLKKLFTDEVIPSGYVLP